jgi:NTP pyrophosphatase (non-canonical NTP hydrolase)
MRKMMKHEDNEMTIRDFRDIVSEFVTERDWAQFHTPKSLAIALSIEVAELLEHFLFKQEDTVDPEASNYQGFTEEMADIFIYLMSLTNSLNLDSLSDVILEKIEKNRKKYPIDQFSGLNYKKQ